jgi:poly(hydroxyalkanoate) granule-associated protein
MLISKEFEMVKKTLKKKVMKKKVQAKPAASNIAAPVVDSAREIWLAGLGAFSVAQEEGGKIIDQGNKLFEKLVAEGAKLEKKTRDVAESAVGDIKGEVESKVGAVRKQAVDNWDKLENIFEDRVARVLGQLGVPTADDVNKLSARVQTLSNKVTAMSKTAKPAKAAAKKPAAKKPAVKKATTKKATAKAAK